LVSVVPVKYTIAVHVVDGFEELVHVLPYSVLWKVLGTAPDELIQVHVHELKDKCKPTCRSITAYPNETHVTREQGAVKSDVVVIISAWSDEGDS
jgi:hypothetical protein